MFAKAQRRLLLEAGVAALLLVVCFPVGAMGQNARRLPERVPPKRSSQIQDGFGINTDLPRDPYLPWNKWWWTRLFDAGFKWVRIGQYENSSDRTSWDWIEQKRGVYASSPELEDQVDSLVDNGVNVQVQLLYGNVMYTSPSGKLPEVSIPAPGSFHNDDRSLYSVFYAPKTPEQIAAFDRYAAWMVEHFRDRIHYWALWNEQDIGYWNPWGNPEAYGKVLGPFVETVHKADPQAKVIYGAQADPSSAFTRVALDTCKCAPGIDVYAYHTYPGYGRNLQPEAMDTTAYKETTRHLRDVVTHYPGIKQGIPFFDDEFNSIPSWKDMDESVQAKYVTRGLIYNLAAGVKTFVWLLAAGTDGNEYDDFGFIHGLTNHDYDWTPRPAFYALQNVNALFSDTKFDPTIELRVTDGTGLQRKADVPLLKYGFRSRQGKSVVAYWMAAHSEPGNAFPELTADFSLKNGGITHPVLVDVISGEIKAVEWKKGTNDTLQALPVKDSVMAIVDESYFDWAVLPEAPSSLEVNITDGGANLKWQIHGGEPTGIVVERRMENAGGRGKWERIAKLAETAREFTDGEVKRGQRAAYRVRAANANGESAYSNVARIE